MHELAKLGGWLLSPFTLAMGLGLLSVLCLALRRRTLALRLAVIAFAGLWIASLPVTAMVLIGGLENEYPALAAESISPADAILILGGSVASRHPPKRPSLGINSASSRVWYAAELYRAGKAKRIVVAAGGQPEFEGQAVEAEAINEMLLALGVPASAIRVEDESRTTRENAANVAPILQSLGVHSVLLVTSAQHMPRAFRTFKKVWAHSGIEVIPAPTDVQITGTRIGLFSWIPSPNALIGVTRALKEYAGMAVLTII